MDFIAHIEREWAVITGAPLLSVIWALVLLVLSWIAVSRMKAHQIGNLESRIAFRDDEITDLKRKLNRAPKVRQSAESTTAKPLEAVTAKVRTPPAERVFVPANTTPESLSKMIRGLNAIQAQELTEPYAGKWIKTSGKVLQSGISSNEVYFSIEPSYVDGHISAYFTKETEGLEIISNGDIITLIGEIEQVTSTGLILLDCEIVN